MVNKLRYDGNFAFVRSELFDSSAVIASGSEAISRGDCFVVPNAFATPRNDISSLQNLPEDLCERI